MLIFLLDIEYVDIHLNFSPASTEDSHLFINAGFFDTDCEVFLKLILSELYVFFWKFLLELKWKLSVH